MIINREALRSIYVGFQTIFNGALQSVEPTWPRVATLVPSSTKSEEYKWLGRIPRMREWIGDRVIQNLTAHSFTIRNLDWEVTVAVDRNDIEDDTIGVYRPIIQQMGEEAALHPDELVFSLLARGFEEKCYDGQPFFAPEHKEPGVDDAPVQSNFGEQPLSLEAYRDARQQMRTLKDERGRPLRIRPNLLVVPPQLEGAALEILKAERLANGQTNVYRDSAELLVVEWLSDYPTAWFLLDTTKAVKPLIFQRRREAQFVAKDDIEDDNVFMRREFLYGADARYNAGYGLWQLAFGSTGEGS